MQLQKSLGIQKGDLITVVGAGGKTSIIKILVQELISKPLLVTTTTHFMKFSQFSHKEVMACDITQLIKQLTSIWEKYLKQKIVVGEKRINYNSKSANYKIKGVLPTWIDNLKLSFSELNILVEGDGAANKSIKAPASYEPVVPSTTDILIPVLGMSELGKEINTRYCHRLKYLKRLTNKSVIDQELIVKILTSVNSYGDYQVEVRDYIPILNQVTTDNLVKVREIAFDLVKQGIKKVIITNTQNPNPVLQVIQS